MYMQKMIISRENMLEAPPRKNDMNSRWNAPCCMGRGAGTCSPIGWPNAIGAAAAAAAARGSP
uniref:Uncharacterized protein n=1 Tax=Pristionchus pacificus TaxID=54126 RepID=A0A2A6BZU0_PRIPA|eukprot:PDM71400.1 hypothetical protein PRIPAC_37807 [Pristionchus pacificus]